MVEVVLSISVVLVLTGLGLGRWSGALERGRVAQARAELAALTAALDAFRAEYGAYPQTSDVSVLLGALNGLRGADGSLLSTPGRVFAENGSLRLIRQENGRGEWREIIADPWGNPYRYAYYERGEGSICRRGYILFSNGPDGICAPVEFPVKGAQAGELDKTSSANLDNLHALP